MSEAIRAMQAEDWAAVSSIYQKGMDTNLATFRVTCPSYEDFDFDHLTKPRLVIEVDGAVVGFAALEAVSTRRVYSGVVQLSIYIDAEHQRQGLGTKLLNALIEEAEDVGLWMLEASILQGNMGAIRLLGRCGFRNVGHRERIGQDRFGNWRDTVLMERRSQTVGNEVSACFCCQ